jgi:hypothetical protein
LQCQSDARATNLASGVRFIYQQNLTAGQATDGDMLRVFMPTPGQFAACKQSKIVGKPADGADRHLRDFIAYYHRTQTHLAAAEGHTGVSARTVRVMHVELRIRDKAAADFRHSRVALQGNPGLQRWSSNPGYCDAAAMKNSSRNDPLER